MEDSSAVIDKCLEPVFTLFGDQQDIHQWFRDMAGAVCQDVLKLDPTGAECARVFAAQAAECFELNFNAVESQVKSLDPDYRTACTKGCSYCCTSHITLMPQEAFRIADMLRKSLGRKDLKGLLKEISKGSADYDEKGFRGFGEDYFRPCPFLKENHCAIYDIRPLTCRNWISQDIEACKISYESRNRISVPQNAILMIQKELVIAGQNAALSRYGIKGDICSFLPVLETILEDYEGSYEKWLSGEILRGQLED